MTADKAKYFIDPDFRRDAPDEGPYCIRCQKPIKDASKAIHVTADWETYQVTEGGDELMGQDCWEKITRGEHHV